MKGFIAFLCYLGYQRRIFEFWIEDVTLGSLYFITASSLTHLHQFRVCHGVPELRAVFCSWRRWTCE